MLGCWNPQVPSEIAFLCGTMSNWYPRYCLLCETTRWMPRQTKVRETKQRFATWVFYFVMLHDCWVFCNSSWLLFFRDQLQWHDLLEGSKDVARRTRQNAGWTSCSKSPYRLPPYCVTLGGSELTSQHNAPSVSPDTSQYNPHTLAFYLIYLRYIVSVFHLCLLLLNGIFHTYFYTKLFCAMFPFVFSFQAGSVAKKFCILWAFSCQC